MQETWDVGSIPGSGRCPGGRHSNPLQSVCPENLLDRGASWATVYRVAKSWTWLKWLSKHPHIHRNDSYGSMRFSSVQSLSHVQVFATPWTAACQASLSITISWNLLKLMSIELVMPSNHFILCCPLSSRLQSFPESGSLPTSQFFESGGQSIGASVQHQSLQWIFRTDFL